MRSNEVRTSPVDPLTGSAIHNGITCISWADSCSRSDHLARELGGTSHMVYASWLGSRPSTILFKYAVQWAMTVALLRREQPDVVFVMTPPLFAALPVFWYAWRRQRIMVIDAHTCAFVLPRWRMFQWLQRLLCRRAVTTLVTNRYLGELLEQAGARVTIVPDVPVVFPDRQTFPRSAAFTVAAVCSFDRDEPLEALFAAAARLREVRFYVTGDPRSLPARERASMPGNVTLTGFLSTPAYGGLITDADVVIDLTTFDHTMLRGAYEAIYQGTPVIVSDWPVLREAFPEGAVHVDNTADAIVNAVRTVERDLDTYRAQARRLRAAKLAQWTSTRHRILDVVAGRIEPAQC